MNGLAALSSVAQALAKRQGVEAADLRSVADPIGRVDFLASQLVEQAARRLPPEAQMTYHAVRPLIDGWLTKQFSVRVNVPPEVVEFVRQQLAAKGVAA